MERRDKIDPNAAKERERIRMEEQKAKWSRREESEFLRVVSTYGVNYDRKKAQYDWTKFKSIARFDKKTDADLTDYYMSFRAMCKKACNTKLNEDEGAFFGCTLILCFFFFLSFLLSTHLYSATVTRIFFSFLLNNFQFVTLELLYIKCSLNTCPPLHEILYCSWLTFL